MLIWFWQMTVLMPLAELAMVADFSAPHVRSAAAVILLLGAMLVGAVLLNFAG